MHEKTTTIRVSRHDWVTDRPFDDVRAAVRAALGTTPLVQIQDRLAAATDWDTFRNLVDGAVGVEGLMLFLELDQTTALRLDPDAEARPEVRFVAGNPVTMSAMVRTTPGAGAFAPVTLLVFEDDDGVHLRYDTVVSDVGPELTAAAAPTAHELDRAVLRLLARAAGDD